MKQKVLFRSLLAGVAVLASGILTSCSTENDDYAGPLDYMVSSSSPENGNGNGQSENSLAGVVTAGEWNDLDHWDFWSKLMLGQTFSEHAAHWSCFTNHRVPVVVTDEKGNPLAGLPVQLVRNQSALWEAVTDNHGQANLWLSPWQSSETIDAEQLSIVIDGQPMEQQPVVWAWDSLTQMSVNSYVYTKTPATAVRQQADIAFVVDATGSMSDEIDFLKSDLLDIVNRVKALRPEQTLRTAALFYRDEGDDYVTRHQDFNTDARKTADFISKQEADGGGDYPEALHTALEHMLQDLSWSSDARTRLTFLILDAPAHHENDVIRSLQQSLASCARLGIRLIPVAASGVDKGTEFMLRFFATLTGGTYVFLTNDSGVGLEHIEATVGDYEVERLNELLIRLIGHYTE